eukprot:COSAG04_NODE_43_length_31842_cov_15.704848_18_plen_34_part_00
MKNIIAARSTAEVDIEDPDEGQDQVKDSNDTKK